MMIRQHIVAVLLIFFALAANAAETPIREGLGFAAHASPDFSDELLLQSIQQSVTESKIAPVQQIELQGSISDLGVKVLGEGQSAQFTCSAQGGVPVCHTGSPSEVLNEVAIPFGNLKAQGITSMAEHGHAWSTPEIAGFAAAGFVAVYVAKKIYNKIMTGSLTIPEDDHDHGMFPTAREMNEEITENRALMRRALARAEENLERDLIAVATGLASVAACNCGHDHSKGHGPKHPLSFVMSCQDVTPTQATEARESIFKRMPKFAVAFAKDFYKEMVSPYVTLVKAIADKDKRRQAWGFMDLILRRMINERGVGAALATAGFIGLTQGIWEVIESLVMPNGLHLFCTVVNAALLGVAATMYTKFHCYVNINEMRNLSLEEKRQAMGRISRQETPMIKSMHTLFKYVERDARYMRHLNLVDIQESRVRAAKLGELKKELNLLTLKHESKQDVQGDLLKWMKKLGEMRESFEPVKTTCTGELAAS